jgi:dTMP kinase
MQFITFEGTDGSGKSTQAKLFSEYLNKTCHSVILTKEPGGTEIGSLLRSLLLHDRTLPNNAETFLFAADRAIHVEKVIKPQLRSGGMIVCDRFIDSTIAYQGYGRGLDIPTLKSINELSSQGIKPHVTFWLDIDPVVGLTRCKERDHFESQDLAFYDRVRDGFAAIAAQETDRVIPIRAIGSAEDIHSLIVEWFENHRDYFAGFSGNKKAP